MASAVIEAPLRKRQLGMDKGGNKDKDNKNKGVITDEYDFLRYIVKAGICLAVPIEQALVCAREEGFSAYVISLSQYPFTDVMSYCCDDFSDVVDLMELVKDEDCEAATAEECLMTTRRLDSGDGRKLTPTFNSDFLFIPEPTLVSSTETNPLGACCEIEYPTFFEPNP